MTGGDAFPKGVTAIRPRIRHTALSYRWYGSRREREGIRAMGQLGVHRSQIRLLGFPDEGLCVLASLDRAGTPFESPYTRRDAPPESEQIVRGTTYRGDDLVLELTHLIEAFRPTLVVLPDPGDEHPDHGATHLLVHRAVADALDAGDWRRVDIADLRAADGGCLDCRGRRALPSRRSNPGVRSDVCVLVELDTGRVQNTTTDSDALARDN